MPVLATTLDEPAAGRVRALWDRLEAELGLSGVRKVPFPHLTWLGCELMDTPQMVARLEELSGALAPIPARATSLGIFLKPAPVLHLAVVRNPELDYVHGRLWELVEPCATELHGLYRPDVWVPHITLALGDLSPELLPRAVALLADFDVPLTFTLRNLTLFDWIGPHFEPIERFPLRGR